MSTFALTGLAGYVAPRHLRAIRETGNDLVAALDPHDSVGIIDRYFPDAAFFTEPERFDRHLESLRLEGSGVDVLSVCSPNHLHDAHVRLALRTGADALCEKPLVLSPWNLDALASLEVETGRRVWTVLQLRLHPGLLELKRRLDEGPGRRHAVRVIYITRRGAWYRYSWKGNPTQSGGLSSNIGVHLFDLLLWLFGPVDGHAVHLREATREAGTLSLARADVEWSLSIDAADLSDPDRPTVRSIHIDDEHIEFSDGFEDLHTRVYAETMAGRGVGIEDARPSIELVHALRQSPVVERLDGGGRSRQKVER
jgi:UDP-N-acetyl-2-amino-2-deoxyglucuronate dehydrogenase